MRKEVLLLTHRIPYPPNKGDKIRSWRLLSYLNERFDVHLASFIDDPLDEMHADFLSSICASTCFVKITPALAKLKSSLGFIKRSSLSEEYYYNREVARYLDKCRHRPLVAEIAYSSTMAQYIKSAKPGSKKIVDLCDADSEKWRDYAFTTAPPMSYIYQREADLLHKKETDIINWADACFAVTALEADLFNCRKNVKKKVGWWSNGVDTNYFSPKTCNVSQSMAEVVFVGAMDYKANYEAVLQFVQSHWIKIRSQHPNVRFAIVGSNPVKNISLLNGHNGIIVTGRVADVRPWLAGAKAVVVPLEMARGIQNKILEAMAMGKPVVVSPAAIAGIEAIHNHHVLIGNNSTDVADHVIALLKNEKKQTDLGAAARKFMVNNYQWENQLSRLDIAFADL